MRARTPAALGLGLLATATIGCTQAPGTEPIQRWRAHYAAVERELLAHVPPGLGAEALRARGECIEVLRLYRERGEFPRQDGPGLAPRFVDAEGRRCAVAELLHASGHDAMVARIAREANGAWVVELGADPELSLWLTHSGLTLAEAARIQTPAGCSSCDAVPPGGGDPPEPSSPGSRGSPRGNAPSAPATTGSPTLALIGSSSAQPPEDAWWVWWEYNKLAHLEVRGLERRLAERVQGSRAQAAEMTEPLRRPRTPLLAPLLQDPDARVRAAAALAFGRVARGEEVLALLTLFEDPSRTVRESALFGLGASGSSEGAQVLLALLEHGGAQRAELAPITPRAVPLAILALAKGRRAGMDPGLAPAVARMAQRAPEAAREAAQRALCAFQRLAPDPEVERVVLGWLEDPRSSRWVRAAAIEALGDSRDPLVLGRLLSHLGGHDLDLRRSAALALGRSPQPLASASLMTAYELESEPLTRGFLLLAIGQRGGVRARDLLIEELERGPLAVEPWAALGLGLLARGAAQVDPEIRRALLERSKHTKREGSRPALGIALGLARVVEAGPLARRTLSESPSLRERGYAATTLALLGRSEDREFLRDQLGREPSDFVRTTIAQALSTLGGAEDAVRLSRALGELADPGLQGVAAASLGQLGEVAALALLEQLLLEPGTPPLVRATALDGLGVLLEHGDPLALPVITQGSNYALYEDWELELFLRAL